MQLHFSKERGKYHCQESALKKEGVRKAKANQPLDEKWTLILMRALKTNTKTGMRTETTSLEVRSRGHGFATAFSNKKAKSYYFHIG